MIYYVCPAMRISPGAARHRQSRMRSIDRAAGDRFNSQFNKL